MQIRNENTILLPSEELGTSNCQLRSRHSHKETKEKGPKACPKAPWDEKHGLIWTYLRTYLKRFVMRWVDNFQRWLPNNINGGINTSQQSFSDSQCCHSENLPAFWLLSEVSVSRFGPRVCRCGFKHGYRWPLTCAVPTAEPWRDVETSPAQGDRLLRRDLKKKRDIRTLMKVWNLRVSSFLEIQVNFQAKDKETEQRMQRFKLRERWLRYFVSHCSKCLGHWRRFWHPFCRLRSSSSSCCL